MSQVRMNEKNPNVFIEILQNNAVQLTFAVMGVAGLLLATYITLRLTPLVEDIHSVTTRVSAIEFSRSQDATIPERFYKLETKVDNIEKSTTRIEDKIDKLETK